MVKIHFDEQEKLQEQFKKMLQGEMEIRRACRWCGGPCTSEMTCPRVKAFEFFGNGKIRRVEFNEPQ